MHGSLEVITCDMLDPYSRREEQVVMLYASETAAYIQSSEESAKKLKKFTSRSNTSKKCELKKVN